MLAPSDEYPSFYIAHYQSMSVPRRNLHSLEVESVAVAVVAELVVVVGLAVAVDLSHSSEAVHSFGVEPVVEVVHMLGGD